MSSPLELGAGRTTRLVAAVFSLAAFTAAIVAGLGAGADATRTILIAMVAMAVCHTIGTIIGSIAERTAAEAVAAHQAANPVPELITMEHVAREIADTENAGELQPDNAATAPAPETVEPTPESHKISTNSAEIAQAA